MNTSTQPIGPIYVTNQVDQFFTLYEGEMNLRCSEETDILLQGTGIVSFNWFPSLRLKFNLNGKFNLNLTYLLSDEVFDKQHILELIQLNLCVRITVSRVRTKSQENQILISGLLHEPEAIVASRDINHLIFHITNFHGYLGESIQSSSIQWKGRLSLEAHGWRVIIDSLEPSKARKELIQLLKNDGGYAVTHVAKLQRIDEQPFLPEDALDILSGLSYFLAFVRGMWVGPMFPIGFDSNDNRVWEKWMFYKASPYQDVMSWFPRQAPKNLITAFVGFMKLWTDPTWQEPLRLSIHWYVESNLQAGAIEGGIIMTQAAFELLFERLLNSSSTRNKADIKLRRLFENANIPLNSTEIFCDAVALKELSLFTEGKNIDLPKAITEIRNSLTHPQRKPDNSLMVHSVTIRYETWRLSLWYLELVFLHLTGYQGSYKNRMQSNWEGNYDQLPWALASKEDGQLYVGCDAAQTIHETS